MSIPLVQNNEKDSINTSIIAIKRQIERINALLGLSNSEEIDTSVFATKTELEDAVTQVETDLAPVNEVTADNMHSVTSNAVAAYPIASVSNNEGRPVTSGAVYSELVAPDTWSDSAKGLTVEKRGNIVTVLFKLQISGGTVEYNNAIPAKYRPELAAIRTALIRNDDDTYAGQFIISDNGKIGIWPAGGSTFNGSYVATATYVI